MEEVIVDQGPRGPLGKLGFGIVCVGFCGIPVCFLGFAISGFLSVERGGSSSSPFGWWLGFALSMFAIIGGGMLVGLDQAQRNKRQTLRTRREGEQRRRAAEEQSERDARCPYCAHLRAPAATSCENCGGAF